MKTIKNKLKNGSVLVFTLIIMSLMLMMAVSIASVTVIERKMSGATGKSNQAFQVADSGVEIVVNKKKDDPNVKISTLGSSCDGGTVNMGDVAGGNAIVTFYADDGTKLVCSDPIAKTFRIKSAGVFSSTVRAVEVEIAFLSCDPPTVSYGGKNYNTVQIGTQCWFKENLNVGIMLDSAGTMPTNPAPTANTPSTVQKWCYDNSTTNCTNEGGLYTWAEANGLPVSCLTTTCTPTPQGICPTDWHIPTDAEQYILENYLKTSGQTCDANRVDEWDCSDAGTKLKSGGNSGFNALLAGYRHKSSDFMSKMDAAYFWSSSRYPNDDSEARSRILSGERTGVHRLGCDKEYGKSVRCLKN